MTDITTDHYTIEVYRDTERVRSHTAANTVDALSLLDGLRESYRQRNNVTWDSDEVDESGRLPGVGYDLVPWQLKVTPPLGALPE
jgi:hypothetical protein